MDVHLVMLVIYFASQMQSSLLRYGEIIAEIEFAGLASFLGCL